jgi:hypothetical protein
MPYLDVTFRQRPTQGESTRDMNKGAEPLTVLTSNAHREVPNGGRISEITAK